ncbi:MAG: OmpH family outer membrane protein [Bryobacteraceae bacterium]
MSRYLLSTIGACAFAALLTAPPATAQVKMGVIDTQKAMLDTGDLKKAQAEMEAKFKPRQEKLDLLTREMAEVQRQLQTMQGKLSAQGEAELIAQGTKKQKEAERLRQDLQEEVERERNDILGVASQKMRTVIQKLAEEKGLDVVVDVSTTIYSKPALDITKDATAAYDKAHPPAP